MDIQEIDHLTEHFYQSISFSKDRYPNYDMLKELFYGSGKIITNNAEQPLDFTIDSFSQTLMFQIESGNATYFSQQEISDTTEIYGNLAQRISVYEHSHLDDPKQKWKRGVNYIQFLKSKGVWLIISMIWQDEKDEVKIPEVYLV